MGLYYRIWVDWITRLQKVPKSKDNWAFTSMLYMTICMTLNFIVIITIVENFIGQQIYAIKIYFIGGLIDDILNLFIFFVLPCICVNYSLIFHNKRYLKLIDKYPPYNGKLAAAYLLFSVGIPMLIGLYAIIKNW